MEHFIESRLERGIRHNQPFKLDKLSISLDVTTKVKYSDDSTIIRFEYTDANGQIGYVYKDLREGGEWYSLDKFLGEINEIEDRFFLEDNMIIADFAEKKGKVNWLDGNGEVDCYLVSIFSRSLNRISYQPTKINDLKYHYSWDSLMPVIKKLIEIGEIGGFLNINTNIIEVYNVVVAAIKKLKK